MPSSDPLPRRRTQPARRAGRIPANDVAAHEAALVAVAGRLFREHGFAATTIELIARAAHASPKTIYARFGGKLGLFEAVLDEMVRRPLAIWDVLDEPHEPAAALTIAAERFLDEVLSPEVIAMERAIIAEAERMPELARVFYDRGPRRGFARLSAYFESENARGRLQVDDPQGAAELFISLVEGEFVRRSLFLGENPGREERWDWVRRAVDLFLLGCRAPDS